jgi:hypothetical protein
LSRRFRQSVIEVGAEDLDRLGTRQRRVTRDEERHAADPELLRILGALGDGILERSRSGTPAVSAYAISFSRGRSGCPFAGAASYTACRYSK